MTFSAFDASAQNALKLAIAQAAGVDVSQVSIVSVTSGTTTQGNRRLLQNEKTLIVKVSISGGSSANKIRKLSKFSVVSHIEDNFSSEDNNNKGFYDQTVSSWQLLRARFQKNKNEKMTRIITQEYNLLSESWTLSHSIQVSKA